MKTYNDVFAEDLVVRQRPLFVALVRCGSIVAGILLTIGAYFVTGMVLKNYSSAVFPMLFALIVIGVVMVFRFTGLEYEYSFYSGDVDIDKIVGKRKRTRLISFNCRDVERRRIPRQTRPTQTAILCRSWMFAAPAPVCATGSL